MQEGLDTNSGDNNESKYEAFSIIPDQSNQVDLNDLIIDRLKRTSVKLAADSAADSHARLKPLKIYVRWAYNYTNGKKKVDTFHFICQNLQNMHDDSAIRHYIYAPVFGHYF